MPGNSAVRLRLRYAGGPFLHTTVFPAGLLDHWVERHTADVEQAVLVNHSEL